MFPSRFFWSAFLLLVSAIPAAADFPIVSHRHLADPAVLVHEDRVYVYCSNDDDSPLQGGYEMKSLVCVSSSDLKNWTDHGEVIRVPRDASWAVHTWAPAVIERNGTFFLYFSNNASGIGVATSNHPTGPFHDPLGRPLINSSTPGVLPAQNLWIFDPAVFVDRDGQAYLYFGGNGESNLRIIRLNEDMISVQGAAQAVTVPNFFEAAWMHEHEGRYYLSYSTVPSAGMRIDYLLADHPMGPFTYGGVVAPQPPLNDNNNHAAIFGFQGNTYHVYHNRAYAREAGIPPVYRRNLAIERLSYRPDGRIEPVGYTRDGLEQVKLLNPYARVEAETFAGQRGVQTAPLASGGMKLTALQDGDWVRIRGVDFGDGGANAFSASVLSAGSGGELVVRLDEPKGPGVARVVVAAGSDRDAWRTVSGKVEGATGVRDIYLTFVGSGDVLFEVDHWVFEPAAPQLRSQPRSLAVAPGGRAQFWVQTSNGGPLTFQWMHNGVAVPGATSEMATLSKVTPDDAGEYRIVVTGATGSVTSEPATLVVDEGAVAELVNLSVRAALPEDAVLIPGFVIDSVR